VAVSIAIADATAARPSKDVLTTILRTRRTVLRRGRARWSPTYTPVPIMWRATLRRGRLHRHRGRDRSASLYYRCLVAAQRRRRASTLPKCRSPRTNPNKWLLTTCPQSPDAAEHAKQSIATSMAAKCNEHFFRHNYCDCLRQTRQLLQLFTANTNRSRTVCGSSACATGCPASSSSLRTCGVCAGPKPINIPRPASSRWPTSTKLWY